MPEFTIRPFRRGDRDQVTSLVNAHAAVVVPGISASVSAVLAQFEREPDEFVVDPWVAERRAVIAEQAGVIVAAALVVRYHHDPDVGPAFRGAGEIRWLVFRPSAPPGNPYWRNGKDAADALMLTCLRLLDEWQVTCTLADGELPHLLPFAADAASVLEGAYPSPPRRHPIGRRRPPRAARRPPRPRPLEPNGSRPRSPVS